MAKSRKADENEPSTTHNCGSSRAPKKSTTLLKQHLTSERRTVKNNGLEEILSRFQVKPQLGKQLIILLCTLLHSAWLADPTRREGQRRPQDPSTPSRRKKINTTNAPSCRRTCIRCRARHCAEEHHAADLPLHHTSTSTIVNVLHPTSNGAVVAQQRAHHELVQELELLQHYGVDELNLEHLHSYPSQGGCHCECCKSRFRQYEPCTVSSRTQAWP